MHGRHHTSVDTITGGGASSPAGKGDVRVSSVAPNTATTFAPTAAARCIAPESLATTACAIDRTPVRVGRSVLPLRSMTGLKPGPSDVLFELGPSDSLFEPVPLRDFLE